MKRVKPYNFVKQEYGECCLCGIETEQCNLYIAIDAKEADRGYIDEFHICHTCEDKREVNLR